MVLCGTVEMGQGARGVLVRETARLLGLPETAIRVPYPDTALTPPDAGTNSSRSSFFNGVAVRRAADDLTRQLRELAARVHEVPADEIRVAAGRVYVPAARAAARAAAHAPANQAAAEPAQGIGGPLADGRTCGSSGRRSHGGRARRLAVHYAAAGSRASRGSSAPASSRPPSAPTWTSDRAAVPITGTRGRRAPWSRSDRETGKVYLLRLHVATHAGRVIDRAECRAAERGLRDVRPVASPLRRDPARWRPGDQSQSLRLHDPVAAGLPARLLDHARRKSAGHPGMTALAPRSSYPRSTGWARRACPPCRRLSAMRSPPLSARRAACISPWSPNASSPLCTGASRRRRRSLDRPARRA